MIRNRSRAVSLILAVCMIISMFSMLTVSAAAPVSLDIARIAEVADSASKAIEEGIAKGQQDVDGVYYGVSYPATFKFTECDMSAEAYILMAANALAALAQGQGTETVIAYKDVQALAPTTAGISASVKNGTADSLNKAQYLELADRVARYGTTMKQLPGSFNRPTDGVNVYDGRITSSPGSMIVLPL